jgi:hypothetical protein
MGYQPQDGCVDRTTSRWWRNPVASACLKTLAVTGFAGVAWLLGGSSAAHADIVDLSGALSSAEHAVSPATELVALPPVASVTGHATSVRTLVRPLAAKASPVPRAVTAAVSSMARNTSGALAPATTPASGAVGGLRAFVRNSTPALDSIVQVGTQGAHDLIAPIGAGHIVAAPARSLRPLAETVQSLTHVVSTASPVPTGGPSLLTSSQLVDAQGGRIASPLQRAIPAQDAAHTGSLEPVAAPQAARTLDGNSSPAAGARTAPALPSPAPAPVPSVPGVGTNSGSTTSSSASQFDGSSGVISAGGHAARLHALRALSATVESGVPLVRDEELAATPD